MMSRAAPARPATGPIHECSLSRWLKTRSVKIYLREESIHDLLAGFTQLFTNYPPKGSFQRLSLSLDVIGQSRVYQRLVVATARRIDLSFEPLQYLFVETNGDSGFALCNRDSWAAPCL